MQPRWNWLWVVLEPIMKICEEGGISFGGSWNLFHANALGWKLEDLWNSKI